MKTRIFDGLEKYFYLFVRISVFFLFMLIVLYTINSEWLYMYETRVPFFGTKKIMLISLGLIVAYLCFLYMLSYVPLFRWNKKIELGMVCCYFLLCIFASYYFANEGNSEIGVVNNIAQSIAYGRESSEDYITFMSRYSYIRTVTCYAAFWYKLGGKILTSFVLCVGMTLGYGVSLQMVKRFGENEGSCWICSGLYFISVPVFLSCSVFYNYTTVFWIPVTIIYLFTLYIEETETKKRILYISLIILIASIGTSIFPMVSVSIIAIIIDMILKRKKNVILVITFTLLSTNLINTAAYKIVNEKVYNTEERQKMVAQNEIPMLLSTVFVGLNVDSLGYVTMDDIYYLYDVGTDEEKAAELQKRIVERAKKIIKSPSFIFKKSAIQFGSGTYYTEIVSNDRLLRDRSIIKFFSANFEEVKYYLSFFCAINVVFNSLSCPTNEYYKYLENLIHYLVNM